MCWVYFDCNIKRIFQFVFSVILFSCTKNEEKYQVCNCLGDKIENVHLDAGVITNTLDGFKIISTGLEIVTPCQDLSEEFKVEGKLVQFSGKMISTCRKEHYGYGIYSTYVEISSITGVDTLYQNGPLTIKIVRTADYNNKPGFGYIIEDKIKAFKINQTSIPALSLVPFDNQKDATKIAFLVGYRLRHLNDFPSIDLGDLLFLKIITQQ
jgi:hypothetical protein